MSWVWNEDMQVEVADHDFEPNEDGECIHCGELASRNHHGWMS